MKKILGFVLLALIAVSCSKNDDNNDAIVEKFNKEQNQQKIDAIGAEFLQKVNPENLEDLYVAGSTMLGAFNLAPLPDRVTDFTDAISDFFTELNFEDLLGQVAAFDGEYADMYGKYTFNPADSSWLYTPSTSSLLFVVGTTELDLVMSGGLAMSTGNDMTVPENITITVRNADGNVIKVALDNEAINMEELDYVTKLTIERGGVVRVLSLDLSNEQLALNLNTKKEGTEVMDLKLDLEHTITSAMLVTGDYDILANLGAASVNVNVLNKFYAKGSSSDMSDLIALFTAQDTTAEDMNNLFKMTWGFTATADDQGYGKIVYDDATEVAKYVLVFNLDNSECNASDFFTPEAFSQTLAQVARLTAIINPDLQ